MEEIARQAGQTVRDAMGSVRRTVCLCLILIAAGTAIGISVRLGR